MRLRPSIYVIMTLFAVLIFACQAVTDLPLLATPIVNPTVTPVPSPLPPIPVMPGEDNPDEPVFIYGDIPYTSPFFINMISEPFVLLEDQAGFVRRDREFEFMLEGQVIGPVKVHEDDNTLTYSLSLPAIPQGTLVDVDNDGQEDTGVQVFAIAFWSNTWGGPFLEDRDGTGWSTAYASTITDPEQDDEITGGTLLVWSPDDQQGFPTGFGDDGLLFTEDDPTGPIPAGYNLVELDSEPFRIYKEARPRITLVEGDLAVNDYSQMSYTEAFEAMFEKASREYPFTEDKNIDWEALRETFAPRVASARDGADFYLAIRDFTWAIPDAHVGVTFNPEVFLEERGGGFGLVLQELSDGRVIVTLVLPGSPAEEAGMQPGTEVLTWNGQSIGQAISEVTPYFGPYSTEHHRRLEQVVFLTRVPPGDQVEVSFQNPGESSPKEVTMQSVVEYESLFAAIPTFSQDEAIPPIEGEVLDDSGLGYIRINTFSDDYSLMARLWEHYLEAFIDVQVPGLILDVRTNSGGSGTLAVDFAGYFFDEEILLSQEYYYNERTQDFEATDYPSKIEPAPFRFEGPVAVLVSPYCVSACEGFVNAMTSQDRATVVGHYPTAGAFGEVGRGQYELPEDLSLQFPTGRPETPEGELLIEGVGVEPDISVPVTEESALGEVDAVLESAIEALRAEIN